MLAQGEINPLNVFGLRELITCPPHFVKVNLSNSLHNEKEISDWITLKLTGRFCFGQSKSNYSKFVAFEISSEASYFALMADTIGKKEILWVW